MSEKQAEQTELGVKKDKTELNENLDSELPQSQLKFDFNAIYYDLHSRFPNIINMEKPVLLAVGIRKELAYATGIPGVVLNKWIAWYFRKSKYHRLHKEGAVRYNLQGEEVGVVTENHMQRKAKQLEKIKQHQLLAKAQAETIEQMD